MLPCWIECFRKTEKEKKIHKLQKQNCPFSKNIYSTKLRLNFHHANVVIWRKKKRFMFVISLCSFFISFFQAFIISFSGFVELISRNICFQFSVFSYNFFSSFVSFTFIYVIFGDIYNMCSPVHQSVFFINVVVCMYIYFKRCLVLRR